MKRLHKGDWYWSTSREAQDYADKHGLTRVTYQYGWGCNGWTVQLQPSGPYAGPWLESECPRWLSTESRESYKENS
jgi:hypothetical protein